MVKNNVPIGVSVGDRVKYLYQYSHLSTLEFPNISK